MCWVNQYLYCKCSGETIFFVAWHWVWSTWPLLYKGKPECSESMNECNNWYLEKNYFMEEECRLTHPHTLSLSSHVLFVPISNHKSYHSLYYSISCSLFLFYPSLPLSFDLCHFLFYFFLVPFSSFYLFHLIYLSLSLPFLFRSFFLLYTPYLIFLSTFLLYLYPPISSFPLFTHSRLSFTLYTSNFSFSWLIFLFLFTFSHLFFLSYLSSSPSWLV